MTARPAPRDRQPKQQRKTVETPPTLRIKFAGKTYDLDPSKLGPGDDLICRQQVGFPLQGFLTQEVFGADSLLVLVWTCRRKAGEPNLTFAEVLAEYPTYESLNDAGFDIESIDDDPEG